MASTGPDYLLFLDVQRLFGDRGASEVFRLAWLVGDRRARVLDAKQLYVRPVSAALRQRLRLLLQPSDAGAERIVEALEAESDRRGVYPVLISNDIAVMYNLVDAIEELAAYSRQAFVQYDRRFGTVVASKGILMQLVHDLEQQLLQQAAVGPESETVIRNSLDLVLGDYYICPVRSAVGADAFAACREMHTRFAQDGGMFIPEHFSWNSGLMRSMPRNGYASGTLPYIGADMMVGGSSWPGAFMPAQSVAMGIPAQMPPVRSHRDALGIGTPFAGGESLGTASTARAPQSVVIPSSTASAASTVAPATPVGSVVRLRGLPWSATTRDVAEWIRQPPAKATMGADSSLLEDFIRRPLQVLPGGIVFVYNHQGRKTGEVFVQFASPEDASRCLHKHEDRMGHRYIEVFLSSHQDMWNLLSRYEAKRAALGLGAAGSPAATSGAQVRNGNRTDRELGLSPAKVSQQASAVAMGVPLHQPGDWTPSSATFRPEMVSHTPPEGLAPVVQAGTSASTREGPMDLMSATQSPCLRLSGVDATVTERDVHRFIAPFQLDTSQGASILACFADHGVRVPPGTTIPPVFTVRNSTGQPSGEFTLVFQNVSERDRALCKSGQLLGSRPVKLSSISCFELAAALGILGITRAGV
jgi:hypothetical protein